MRSFATFALFLFSLTLGACSGVRGSIGNQAVCTNDYFLGVISISELVRPCGNERGGHLNFSEDDEKK